MGRWGSSLQAALSSNGMAAVEIVKGREQLSAARLDAELIWLCVPDASIEEVAQEVALHRPSLKGQTVLHSSGVYSSAVLAAARKAGARVGSVHPLMTFPTRRPVLLAGVPFAVEGMQIRRLEGLVRLLGGEPFQVSSSAKALYHAAAVMASPLLVSLATAARTTASLAGLTNGKADALLEPIMAATVHNFFQHGGAASFSGPFARGDIKTVSLHLEALETHPSLRQVYRELALFALDALPAKNKRQLRAELSRHTYEQTTKRGSLED